MQESTLIFTDGSKFPGCTVHLNQRFPSFYAVQLMTGGSLYFQREGFRRVELTTPTFFWTDAVSNYQYGPGPSGRWEHNWVSFTGDHADTYYKPLLEALAPEGHVSLTNAELVEAAFGDLIEAVHVRTDLFRKVHLLNRVLDRVHRGQLRPSQPGDRIHAIKEAIDANPEHSHDFPSLARKAGYSYSNFRRLFRERYDSAPHAYLINRRMQRAAQLLMQTFEEIQEIGFRLGYEDPARFSKAFKQYHGIAPRDYRRRSLQATFQKAR
ncbi:MAG: helix-turn-helix transcriptional regulator [Puniceicoccaceae bacterium]